MNLYFQKAFTLVELMVSVAIIALLSAVALASVSSIQKASHDTQRQADIRAIQTALQQFYADQNRYPDTVAFSGLASVTDCTGVNGCVTPTKTYLSNMPKDPTPGTTTPYCYTAYLSSTSATSCTPSANSGLCHFYKLDSFQENPKSATTYTCNSNATYRFEVTPL